MRRTIFIVALITVSAALMFAQQVYNPRLLESLGISQEQADEIAEIQEETATGLRRLHADQEIKKAELARLLIEDEPDMRQVERNLRDSAEIEVQIRLNEIEREIAIRSMIGMEAWTRLMAAARAQREASFRQQSAAPADRTGDLQQSLSEQQRRMNELQEQRELMQDPEIRERFQRLQEEFADLQRLIREQLQ